MILSATSVTSLRIWTIVVVVHRVWSVIAVPLVAEESDARQAGNDIIVINPLSLAFSRFDVFES